jgi:hypothetical protein
MRIEPFGAIPCIVVDWRLLLTTCNAMKTYADAVLDPFIEHTEAFKLPDEYQGRTIGLKFRSSYLVEVNATGAGVALIQPRLDLSFVYQPTVTGTSWSLGAGIPHDDYTDLNTNFIAWRPISMGVEATFQGKESDASGEIVMVTEQGSGYGGLPLDVNQWRDLQGAINVPIPYLKTGPVVAMSNFDRPSFKALNLGFTETFPSCGVAVIGYASGTVTKPVRINVEFNLELIPRQTSIHHHLATPSPTTSSANLGLNPAQSRRLADASHAVTEAGGVSALKLGAIKVSRKGKTKSQQGMARYGVLTQKRTNSRGRRPLNHYRGKSLQQGRGHPKRLRRRRKASMF